MTKHRLPTLAAFAAAMALVPSVAQAADPETKLMSRLTGPNVAADHHAGSPAVSGDGRFVVFSSPAANLSNQDLDGNVEDVFLRDRETGLTSLVSRNGAPANNHSSRPVISADGRYVAYHSEASNLSPDDGDTQLDVFVYDRQAGTTRLVSRATGMAGAKGDDQSRDPSISADGSRIAFLSYADNLSDLDLGSDRDAYVRDVAAGTTRLASIDGTNAAADDTTTAAVISGDGGHVAFVSYATNIAGGGAPGLPDVFVRDLDGETTALASRPTGFGPTVGNGDSIMPAISHDGRFVAFASAATNLVATDDNAASWRILRRDMLTGTTILVSRANGANGEPNHEPVELPSISADGATVAFAARDQFDAAAIPAALSVYVRRPVEGTTTLVSQSGGTGANAGSSGAAISADGTAVAFSSAATNLDPGAQNGLNQVFLRAVPYVAPEPQPEPPAQQPQPPVQQPQPEPEVQPEVQPEQQPAPPVVVEAPSATTPKLRMKLVRLGATKAKVRVTCLAGECTGVLRLKRTPKQGGQRLGKATFAISAGTRQTVTVKLRRQANAKKVRATATVRPTGLPKQVVAKKLRLR